MPRRDVTATQQGSTDPPPAAHNQRKHSACTLARTQRAGTHKIPAHRHTERLADTQTDTHTQKHAHKQTNTHTHARARTTGQTARLGAGQLEIERRIAGRVGPQQLAVQVHVRLGLLEEGVGVVAAAVVYGL